MTDKRKDIRLSYSCCYSKGLLDATGGAASSPLLVYADPTSADLIHSSFGGRAGSRSLESEPLRGEGTIPSRDGLFPVECYMVEEDPIHRGSCGNWRAGVKFMHFVGRRDGTDGFEIYAPVSRKSRRLADDWPVVVTGCHSVRYENNDEARPEPLYLLKPDELLPFFNGGLSGLREWRFESSFIRYPSTGPKRLVVILLSTSEVASEKVEEIIFGLFRNDLKMVWGSDPMPITPFTKRHNFVWDRLNIAPCTDGMFYLMRGGIATSVFTREELTLDRLRSAAPPDTWVISADPIFFIQMNSVGRFEACGVFNFNGSKDVDFEIDIARADLEAALEGRFHHLRRRLLHGALCKYRNRRHPYLSLEEIRREARGKESLTVRLEDSLAAGNCSPGTRAFADKHFPDRQVLTVQELLPHAVMDDVMRVLAYKLGLVQCAA